MTPRAGDTPRREPPRARPWAEFVATAFCYGVCLGVIEADHRVDLFESATGAMRAEVHRGRTRLVDMLRTAWRVMGPVVGEDGPRPWDWRLAARHLFDVPQRAAMTAVPFGLTIALALIVVGHPVSGLVAGLVVAGAVLVARSLVVVQQGIRRTLEREVVLQRVPEMDGVVTLANLVTLLRMFPCAILIPLLAAKDETRAAAVVYLVAVLGDFVDGFIARYLGQESRLGSLLDPFVDVVVVILGLLGLALLQSTLRGTTQALMWLVLAREVLVLVVAIVLWLIDQAVRPNRAGHAASAFAVVGSIALYAHLTVSRAASERIEVLAQVMLACSILGGLISVWNYLVSIRHKMTWPRGEGITEKMPVRAIQEALAQLEPEEWFGDLRELLRELITTSGDSRRSPFRLVANDIRQTESTLTRARRRHDRHAAGKLEERLRTLKELQRRLS